MTKLNIVLLTSLIAMAIVVLSNSEALKAQVNDTSGDNSKIQRASASIKQFIKECIDAVDPNRILKSQQNQISACSLIITGIEAACFENPNGQYKGVCTDPNLIKFDELKGQQQK